jgi:hypothetical protein
MPSKMKTCEDYRVSLMDAAASDAAPSHELSLHLDACLACSRAFAEEKQLFGAIDAGLRAETNAKVPTSLLPRVRAQLNEQPVPRHSWVPVGAVVVAAVALLAVIVFARGLGRESSGVDRDMQPRAKNAPPAAIHVASIADGPVKTASTTEKHNPSRPARNAQVTQAESLTVLISAGQKRAIEALVASVRQGEAKANIVLIEQTEASPQDTGVAPLAISPIELKPLADLSSESPLEDGKHGVEEFEQF